MRIALLLSLATILAALGSCAPFQVVPGDICNDPTMNYAPQYAYECNHH